MTTTAGAFRRAWRQVPRLLFRPFRLSFWLRMALLYFLMQGFSLINLYLQFEEHTADLDLTQISIWNLKLLPFLITATVTLLVGLILFKIIATFYAAASRILFYDGVRTGLMDYLSSFRKHCYAVFCYFVWKITFAVFALTGFIFLSICALALSAWLVEMKGDQAGLLLLLTLGIGGLINILLFGFFYSITLDSIVVPLMIFQDYGVMKAWSRAFDLIFASLGEFILYAYYRFTIGIAETIIFLFAALFTGVFTYSLIGLFHVSGVMRELVLFLLTIPASLFGAFFLLPIPILKDAFAIAFMNDLTGNAAYSFKTPVKKKESVILSTPEWNPTPIPTGPISFRDIPLEEQNSSLAYSSDEGIASKDKEDGETIPPAG